MNNNPNTQLPVEMAKVIVNESEAAMLEMDRKIKPGVSEESRHHFLVGYQEGWASGATAYATKLHQVEQENEELHRQNDKMKEQAEGWRPLFEDILRDHRNGYINIDEAICSRIKQFLYGE